MVRRFNPPPGWPTPPSGWSPPPDWRPDTSWPTPPDGWPLWVDAEQSQAPRGVRPRLGRWAVATRLGNHWKWVAVAASALCGLIGGLSTALLFGGVAALVVALIVLARWFRVGDRRRSRLPAVLTGVAGLVALLGGAAIATSGNPQAGTQPGVAGSAGGPSRAAQAATPTGAPPPTTTAAPPAPGSAFEALTTLPVKGRAPKTGYSRARFGSGWATVDGCDTRDRVLRRDLEPVRIQGGTNGCLVRSGVLDDPYTGRRVAMVRGLREQVDIDHVVALSDAWQKGAQQLSLGKRIALANDQLNLLATNSSTNESKGDGDAATWLPPNKGYRCSYVARQVSVKARYGLWVTAAEKAAMSRVLTSCPTQPVITQTEAQRVHDRHPTYVDSAQKPTAKPSGRPAHGGTDPQFATCKDAVAAGYGPYVRGRDPEYDWYVDGDRDGVVCER